MPRGTRRCGYSTLVTHLHEIQVRVEKGQFVGHRHRVTVVILDNIAVNLRQLVQELHGQAPVLNDKFGQYAEIVEHEMRVNLLFKGVELGLHGKYLETLFLILGGDVGVQIMGVGVHTRYEGG